MKLAPQSKKIYWLLVLLFFLFSTAVGLAGYFLSRDQKTSLLEEKRDQLSAIAELKVGQVLNWRKELIGEGEFILENSIITDHVHQWLARPNATGVKRQILNLMASLQKWHRYQDLILLDRKGSVRLTVPEGIEIHGSCATTLALEAMTQKKAVLSDLHRDEPAQGIHLCLAVPLLVSRGHNAFPIAVLLLRIDPYRFLFPLIQSWPTSSHTAETLLVRREGEEVVYLNELRHRKGTALNLRFPLSEQYGPASMAVRGQEGIVEGFDYQGVPVLAALQRVPDSSWFLVAEVDKEEIHAPIRMRTTLTAILTTTLIFVAAVGVGVLWGGQYLRIQKEKHRAETERLALAQRFDYLTRYANDIILLVDYDLRIVEANDRASESYGYQRDELLHLSVTDLRPPEEQPILDRQRMELDASGKMVVETFHRRKDGTIFPVEISSRKIEIEGRKFYQGIIRDITERKRVEEALREKTRLNQILLDSFPCVALLLRPDDREIVASNAAAAKVGAVPGAQCFGTWGQRNDPCPWCLAPALWATGEAKHLEVEALGIVWDAHWIPVSPDLYMHYAFDVTARRLEEQERESLFAEVTANREQLRTLARRLFESQETERRLIGRELHDEVGQLLTGLKFVLEMGIRLPADAIRESFEEAQSIVNDLMARVRQLSLDLRPSMLDDLGLPPALLWLFERYTAQTQVRVKFEHLNLEGQRFAQETETAAYRIVQEALTNLARHSGASEATVRIWARPDTLIVQIEDQGKGFDPEIALSEIDRRGLAGMRERVLLLGGLLTIDSTPGKGARLTAELPLGSPFERRKTDEPDDDRSGG